MSQNADSVSPNADYVRQLEDACLVLWAELPTDEVLLLRQESPSLVEFLRHLHHKIEHVEAMVRVNVWAEQIDRSEDDNG